MTASSIHRWRVAPLVLLVTAPVTASFAGCKGSAANQPTLGRAESVYRSLGGPDFVGPDGGISTRLVFDWFDAHNQYIAKFDGPGGVCNGYEPAGPMAQRERTVCAGSAHASLKREMDRERGR